MESFEVSLALEILGTDTGEHQELVQGWKSGAKFPDHHGLKH
jgi:hypothetical protein